IIAPDLKQTYVLIEVEDTGSGISEEEFPRIFEPFYTTKASGHGLGLSAILGIVRSHEGALGINSELGRGTKFKLLFPAASGNAAETKPPTKTNLPAGDQLGIAVIVDDEQIVRDTVSTMLEAIGFNVIPFSEGRT